MARRRRKSSSESSDSEASTSSSSGSYSTLSNDTDTPFIPAYSESRTTQLGLYTMYATNVAMSAGASDYVKRINQPLRIEATAAPQNCSEWIGDTDLAISSVLEKMPRIVTTPGDLTDTQIRSQIQTYITGIIDLLAIYLPVAAMKGYSASMPLVSGYVDNYLASVGCKPWQVRQMQTLFRSLPVPPNLVRYLMEYYAVKQHPRAPNLHHFMPICGYSADETGGSAVSTLDCFLEAHATVTAITDYEEFVSYLKMSGYPQVDLPDQIPPVSDAKMYEIQVNSAPFARQNFNSDTNDVMALPTFGYKDRLLTVSRYVEDLGPSFIRGLCPSYGGGTSAGWDSTTNTFHAQSTAANRPVIVSMGHQVYSNSGSGITDVGSCQVGFLSLSDSPSPRMYPSPANAMTNETEDALIRSASSNGHLILGSTGDDNSRDGLWIQALAGNITVAGAGRLFRSSTVDPETYDVSASTTNLANAKQVYDTLLAPA